MPVDRTLLQERGEEVELFREEPLVVIERVAEQREGFREGAAAQDDFRAAVGHRVEGREALEDADRIVGTQHRHGGTEMDALGAPGDRGQHHVGRRDREIVPMVFADADEVDADLIGENAFLDDVAQHLRPATAACRPCRR